MAKILITGGYGFIGSNLVRYWLDKHPDDEVTILDCKTYAARPDWVEEHPKSNGVAWWKIDLRDLTALDADFHGKEFDAVFHLAAESHVCTSIKDPRLFYETNTIGTFNLLRALQWHGFKGRFVHVSTDEVFGDCPIGSKFHESYPIQPRSPYAASKAASDHVALSFHHTYGMDVVVTNCSNNFGPNQHLEKLMPKTILSLARGKPVTIYGSGNQIRDWLWVGDHCSALETVLKYGKAGDRYCVGGSNERANMTVVMDIASNLKAGFGRRIKLSIDKTDDRPTDDQRYAVSTNKLKGLGWMPAKDYHEKLRETIGWYLKEYRA